MAGGKTYSQLSAESLAQPNNTQLAGLVSTVFKGETLRSMLLNAYGWWKVSQITYIISLVAFGLGGVAGLGSIFLFVTGRRNKVTARCCRPATTAGQGRMTASDPAATSSNQQKHTRIRPAELPRAAGRVQRSGRGRRSRRLVTHFPARGRRRGARLAGQSPHSGYLETSMNPSLAANGLAAVDLNAPGSYLTWSIFTISVANLVLIAVMVAIFGIALLAPFPGRRHGTATSAETEPGAALEPADPVESAGALTPWASRRTATTPTRGCGRPGYAAGR